MKLYKAMNPDLTSFRDGTTAWKLGEWMPEIENASEDEPCGTGYHLGTSPHNAFVGGRFPARLFVADGRDQYGCDPKKARFRSARIVRELHPRWLREMNALIRGMPDIPWLKPQGDPLPDWRVFETRSAARDAAGAAAREAAWEAAWDAARDAAGDAAWEAAMDAAMDAARDAARDAAGAVAMDAARAAAMAAAMDAARDAALESERIICGSRLAKPHADHILARWDVWRRGYGLLCDVGGTLYVHRRMG